MPRIPKPFNRFTSSRAKVVKKPSIAAGVPSTLPLKRGIPKPVEGGDVRLPSRSGDPGGVRRGSAGDSLRDTNRSGELSQRLQDTMQERRDLVNAGTKAGFVDEGGPRSRQASNLRRDGVYVGGALASLNDEGRQKPEAPLPPSATKDTDPETYERFLLNTPKELLSPQQLAERTALRNKQAGEAVERINPVTEADRRAAKLNEAKSAVAGARGAAPSDGGVGSSTSGLAVGSTSSGLAAGEGAPEDRGEVWDMDRFRAVTGPTFSSNRDSHIEAFLKLSPMDQRRVLQDTYSESQLAHYRMKADYYKRNGGPMFDKFIDAVESSMSYSEPDAFPNEDAAYAAYEAAKWKQSSSQSAQAQAEVDALLESIPEQWRESVQSRWVNRNTPAERARNSYNRDANWSYASDSPEDEIMSEALINHGWDIDKDSGFIMKKDEEGVPYLSEEKPSDFVKRITAEMENHRNADGSYDWDSIDESIGRVERLILEDAYEDFSSGGGESRGMAPSNDWASSTQAGSQRIKGDQDFFSRVESGLRELENVKEIDAGELIEKNRQHAALQNAKGLRIAMNRMARAGSSPEAIQGITAELDAQNRTALAQQEAALTYQTQLQNIQNHRDAIKTQIEVFNSMYLAAENAEQQAAAQRALNAANRRSQEFAAAQQRIMFEMQNQGPSIGTQILTGAVGAAGALLAPYTGGASLLAAGTVGGAINSNAAGGTASGVQNYGAFHRNKGN